MCVLIAVVVECLRTKRESAARTVATMMDWKITEKETQQNGHLPTDVTTLRLHVQKRAPRLMKFLENDPLHMKMVTGHLSGRGLLLDHVRGPEEGEARLALDLRTVTEAGAETVIGIIDANVHAPGLAIGTETTTGQEDTGLHQGATLLHPRTSICLLLG